MNTRERMKLVFEHKEPDRVPMFDNAWDSTIARWHKEGLPEGRTWQDEMGIDRLGMISVDNSPQYPVKVVEETEEYITKTTSWGGTEKNWKKNTSTPEFIDFTVKTCEIWEETKKRMTPNSDRINWTQLKKDYKAWQEEGAWINAAFWFGFDITHSHVVGTERFLMLMIDDPEMCQEIFQTELDMDIALFDMVWDAGYRFDSIFWWDDMGFKGKQFFSLPMYRELLKPFHQKAIDYAHAKGIKAHLHSCGNVNPFIPELIDMGLDAINPLEVKAGMDPLSIKKEFGNKLVLHGGINAVNWNQPEVIKEEMRRVIPEVKKNGGYIFASDHSIPDSVSYPEFKDIISLFKKLGSYI